VKVLTGKVIALALFMFTLNALFAPPAHAEAPCMQRSWIPRVMPTAEKEWRVVRLADCAADRWWPGHTREVLAIAWRESHYNPFAENPYSSASGLYQHILSYWPGRAAFYLDPHWFRVWPVPWWNARAATIVSVRMMAAQGGVCPAWC
jgi:hypothetical protein